MRTWWNIELVWVMMYIIHNGGGGDDDDDGGGSSEWMQHNNNNNNQREVFFFQLIFPLFKVFLLFLPWSVPCSRLRRLWGCCTRGHFVIITFSLFIRFMWLSLFVKLHTIFFFFFKLTQIFTNFPFLCFFACWEFLWNFFAQFFSFSFTFLFSFFFLLF